MTRFTDMRFLGQYTRTPLALRKAVGDFSTWIDSKKWPEVTLTCVWRDPAENAKDNGVPNSLHMETPSRAVDIRSRDYTSEQMTEINAWLASRCPHDKFEVITAPHGTGPHIHIGLRRGVTDDA
jgi:hypothetical protein